MASAKPLSLDEALDMNPLGWFHGRILLLCGLAFMSDALEVNLLSYLSTCAGSEFNLNNAQQASISSVVFMGMVIGCSFWGAVANAWGRKPAFLLAGSIISLGGFATAAAPSFGWLLAIRLVVGFGIGAASIAFDLLAEFMPAAQRATFLVAMQSFWTLGSMFVSGMAWALLDSAGWRALAVVTAVPVALATALFVCFMPESPRWLLSKGRNEEAERIVREAARSNGLAMPAFRLVYEEQLQSAYAVDYRQLVADPAVRRITLPLWVVWGMFGFTYYGIILFAGRLFDDHDQADHDQGDRGQCSFNYSALFINSTSELAGCLCGAVLFACSMGRASIQVLFYLLAALAVLLMGCTGISSHALLLLSVLVRMCTFCASVSAALCPLTCTPLMTVCSQNSTWIITPELYNTELRTFGHSLCTTWSKVGSFMSPFVVISSIPPFAVGAILCALNCCAALAAWCLPETSGESVSHYIPMPSLITCAAVGLRMGKVIEDQHQQQRHRHQAADLQYMMVPQSSSQLDAQTNPMVAFIT